MTAPGAPANLFTPAQIAVVESFIEDCGPIPIVWANGGDPFHDGSDPPPEDVPQPWPAASDEKLTQVAAAATASSLSIFAKRGIVVRDEFKALFEPEPPVITEKNEDEDEDADMKKKHTTDDEKVVTLAAARDDARRTRDGDGSHENPFRWRSADMLEQVFAELGIKVRRNIRAHVIEFRDPLSKDTASQWEAANDGATADIRERIAARFWHKARTAPESSRLRFTREALTDYLNALGHHRQVDPFLEWLAQLPPWDGIPRIENILCSLFGAPSDDLTRWASRAPFTGAVQRAHFPGSKIDESPILVSVEQGIGKSTLARVITH